MNKKAMTIFELIIAMMLMAVITILCIKVVNFYTAKNTDVIKFRHTYGAISQVINELKNDTIMYPVEDLGFADGSSQKYSGEEKTYSGSTKFQKLFRSKFNVYKEITLSNLGYLIPIYDSKGTQDITRYTNCRYVTETRSYPYSCRKPYTCGSYGKQCYYTATCYHNKTYTYRKCDESTELGKKENDFKTSLEINCFMDNKGITYCPPSIKYNGESNTSSSGANGDTKKISKIEEMDIYIPVFLNKIDASDPKTTDQTKIIFVKVSKNGKIDLPPIVKAGDETIIDCTSQSYNSYYHCLAIEKLADMNF